MTLVDATIGDINNLGSFLNNGRKLFINNFLYCNLLVFCKNPLSLLNQSLYHPAGVGKIHRKTQPIAIAPLRGAAIPSPRRGEIAIVKD